MDSGGFVERNPQGGRAANSDSKTEGSKEWRSQRCFFLNIIKLTFSTYEEV